MIVQAAPPLRSQATNRPTRAASPPVEAAAPDQVRLSGGAPVNPWPELEKAGVLSAGSSLNGAIGSVITQTVRRDLTSALERLQSGGAKLEYRRRLPLPFGLRPRYEELTPQKTVDFIAKSKPADLGRLEITMPGTERRPVGALKDLQYADAILGAPVLEGAEKTRLECLDSLEANGFKPRASYYYSRDNQPNDKLEAMKTLFRGRELSIEAPQGSSFSAGAESLVALDYFRGSGADRGLKQPEFAARLKQAEQNGYSFRYDRSELDLMRAYQSDLKDAWVRKDGSVLIPVSKDDLGDLAKLGREVHEADTVFREVLSGAYAAMGWDQNDAYFPSAVRQGAQKFPVRVAAAVYAEMLRGAKKSGEDGYRTSERIAALSKKLYAECSTPFELARKASLVGSVYARQGYEAAGKVLSETQEIIAARAASNPQRQEKLEDLFFTLLSATGSIGAASEGMDLVRISVGNESQEDRTRLFQAISRRLPAGSLDQTAFCYRTILAERLSTETLQATGDRFCTLLEGMAVGRHQERAPEVFTYFQQGLRDGSGDPRQADAQVGQFLQALVIHDDVDKALTAAFGGATSQGSVAEHEDAVVIGGVRVPRRG